MPTLHAGQIGYAVATIVALALIYSCVSDARDDPIVRPAKSSERKAEHQARLHRGPYVVRRSDLSTDEQLVQIAIPSAHWDGNPRLDTNCLVYRDLASRSSAMVCPGADGYGLTDDSMGSY